MRYELHCHSAYSKGKKIPCESTSRPQDMARALHRKGFGGFALTDHNTTAGWKEAEKESLRLGLVFVHGMEISTGSGHVIGLGIHKGVRSGLSLEETLESIRAQDGIAIAPHPFDLREEGIGRLIRHVDAVEVFNSLNLTRFENRTARSEARRLGKPVVVGSDAHSLEMLGMSTNWIEAGDEDSVIAAIRKGDVRIEGRYVPIPVVVAWVRERMSISRDFMLEYIDDNYSLPKAVLARFVLKGFIGSRSRFWDCLGAFAIAMSTAYSAARLAKSSEKKFPSQLS